MNQAIYIGRNRFKWDAKWPSKSLFFKASSDDYQHKACAKPLKHFRLPIILYRSGISWHLKMSAAADPAGTWSTAGCRAFALVASPCLVHYSVGWNCFSNQSYAEWVLLDLEDEMSRSVSACSQMASTWRLLDSFSPFGQWYVGEMPYQNGRIIEIALPTLTGIGYNFAGFHFWLFILLVIQLGAILPFLRSYPALSISLFPFDYASMLMLCEANPFMGISEIFDSESVLLQIEGYVSARSWSGSVVVRHTGFRRPASSSLIYIIYNIYKPYAFT